MAKKKKDVSQAQKVGLGIGLTAAAVTAAGAYFLYGSQDAKKNRKKVKSWALKAKGDVLETLEKAEDITEEEFKSLVDGVLSTYGKVQTISRNDMREFKADMAESWEGIVKSGAKNVVAAKKMVKKVSKKAGKKVAKKAPKKTAKKAAKKAPAKKAPKKSTKKVAKKK